jgi:hypothetical protein
VCRCSRDNGAAAQGAAHASFHASVTMTCSCNNHARAATLSTCSSNVLPRVPSPSFLPTSHSLIPDIIQIVALELISRARKRRATTHFSSTSPSVVFQCATTIIQVTEHALPSPPSSPLLPIPPTSPLLPTPPSSPLLPSAAVIFPYRLEVSRCCSRSSSR